MKKSIVTIPNILSFYRIIIFPFILYLAISKQENLFAIFLIISLITDALDGFIARRFNLQTELGARLDSIADIGTFILGITGIFIFKETYFAPHIISFSIFLSLYILSNIISLMKFKRFPSLHLYSWKIGGYIQGIFLIILFGFEFNIFVYYFMITWGILAFSEHIIIQLIIKEMKSNAKGLYWILKENKHGRK